MGLVVLCCGIIAQHRPTTEPFGLLGFDTYLQIQAARITSIADGLDTFGEKLADGNIDPQFYRPLQHLSIALDYALWELEPRGYHLSTLLTFLASALLLYAACLRLLGRAGLVAATIGALFYVLHFTHMNVVPVPARRSEVLCVAFLLAAMVVAPLGRERFWPRIVFASFLVLLGSGAKDIGVMGLGILVLHQLLLMDVPWRRRLVRALWTAMVCGAAVGLYLVNRTLALDGWGGYPPIAHERRTYWEKFQEFWAALVSDLLLPFNFLSPWLPRGWDAPEVAQAMLWTCVGLGLVLLPFGALMHVPHVRRAAVASALGIAWLIPTAVLLGLTPRYGPWYAILPLTGLCLVLAALGHVAWRSVWDGRTVARCGGAALLLLLTAIMLPSLRYSPAFVRYTEMEEASRVVVETLADLDRKIAAAKPGARVVPIAARPRLEKPLARPALEFVPTIQRKGIQAYAALRFPDKISQITVVDLPRFRPE